jgi:hypothetical protein
MSNEHIVNDDHGLTPEEEAALNYKGDEDEEKKIVDPDADPETQAADADAAEPADDPAPAAGDEPAAGAADADPAPAADAEPEPAPAAAAEPAPQPQAAPAPAPILIAQAPNDAKEQLDKIAADKADLIEKWESGEITGKEYQTQLDALNEQQFDLKAQVREAELAQKLAQQQIQNQWVNDCNAFLAQHDEYADRNGERYKLLNETIMALASMPSNQGLSNEKALAKAHRIVQMEMGDTPAPVAKPQAQPQPAKVVQHKVPKPAAPLNIGTLPAADMNDTSGGEFAALNALQKSGDVEAYENAVANMSEAQRARYLRA